MNLADALGDSNNQSQGGPWPGQPANPAWPGQPSSNPTWPGAASGGAWPSQPGQPTNPTWPSQPGQPTNPTWPSQPGQPANPTWPNQPGQPTNPTWPSSGPSPSPSPSAPGGWPSPSPGPGSAAPLVVPYNLKLPNGVYEKLLITIAGVIKPNADKITVDLSTAQDLAFHFNPRFNEAGRKVIVRNSCIGKKWGREERELAHFPFVQGQPFEIKILCTNREFKVAVNNSHLLTYQHRITDLRSINNLNIYYDITLSKVNVETLP